MKKPLTSLALPLLALLGTTFVDLAGQRGGPPRRIVEPETLSLEGGSRVEFRTFHAPALERVMRYSIFLPPSYDKEKGRDFPVVYFLHGMFNDDTSWCVDRYGNLPAAVEKIILNGTPEFLMVHPQGEDSFYTDSVDGSQKFEQYIREDLIREVESRFRVRSERAARAIGGTSMGGYGALKIAMKYPQLFSSVAAGSPIVLLGDGPPPGATSASSRAADFFSRVFANVFGDPIDPAHWRRNSLEQLAKKAELGDLRILMLYGTADRYNSWIPMEEGIRTLNDMLLERGTSAELRIYENENHGWSLVAEHLQETVEFLTGTF